MGRGRSKTGGGASGGLDGSNIMGTTSLVSQREGKEKEVDDVLSVARDIQNRYNVNVSDLEVATIRGRQGNSVMAYYDAKGNLAINKNYFNSTKMDDAYDACVKSGWHPGRGNKTGLEATTAHEMGHRLTHVAGERSGRSGWNLDATGASIIQEAGRRMGQSVSDVRNAISGYGKSNNAEAVAEAFSDWYCNGSKASRASRTVVTVLNEMLGR